MAELFLLGTAGALGDGSREPTSLAVRGPSGVVVIDCGGNPLRQLQRLDVPLTNVERLILTHAHVDHTSGLALFLKMLWHTGRRTPFPIHGPAHTLDICRQVVALWPSLRPEKLFPLDWHPVALEPDTTVVITDDFEIVAAPGIHSVPVIGLRMQDRHAGGALAYSGDGEPAPAFRTLARDVNPLLHEANGAGQHHSSAEQAAEVARGVGARRLVLVHVRPQLGDLPARLAAARAIFGGDVILGEDLMCFEF